MKNASHVRRLCKAATRRYDMARFVLFFVAFCNVCLTLSFGTLLGGVEKVDKNDPELLKALDFAINMYNAESNNLYRTVAEEINDATKQIVAGEKFCIVTTMGTSRSCKNDDEHKSMTLKECPVDTKEMVCKFDVILVPREKEQQKHDLLDMECAGLREKKLRCEEPISEKGNYKKKGKSEQKEENEHDNEIEEFPVKPENDKEEAVISQFNKFMQKYKKSYGTDKQEYMHRLKIFEMNLEKAKKMQKLDSGTAQYGVTQFSDLTEEEFQKFIMRRRWGEPEVQMKQADIPTGDIPDSVDWRTKGVVTPVKNQGTCGSCWAFSTTGNIEGQYAIKTGKLLSLSEQELVDCDKVDHGCEGGLPANAYTQIEKLGGLETESEYPYKGVDSKCKFNKGDVKVTINSSVAISKDENEMAAWLAKNGPISIGINANAMQFYMGGIAHPWEIFCNPKSLNHGVLIVGYGVKHGFFGTKPYWIIKNSWGESWGVQGYYLIYRGAGCCGLNTACTSAVID